MSQFTQAEQKLIQRSCNARRSAERRRNLVPWGFAGACAGAILIVVGSALQLSDAQVTAAGFGETIGFIMLYITLMAHLWLSDRKERVARSVIAKLYRRMKGVDA